MFFQNSLKKKLDFMALESKWRRNAIIQDVPALSRFTAADVKGKFNIAELTKPELPSRSADELTLQRGMQTPPIPPSG